ncbi:chromate efflux transporter [Sphingosinicella sp. LHD-64]|uniref:chromate efflux transporter n=1 Tax=Sphingosinicella sp. LHD-64 TaxID=3072139 RepID=UPI00281011F2|nr:chromate efflux transporter [Sphingosinicella sp. LHD-64]MDQ8754782.1 chromate efflux transporter [Sphingosinicella sp. LHD-64]
MSDATVPPSLTTLQIFWRFLRFGLLAWGGPVAQIAMIRRDLVDEEHWVSSGRFNRLLAVYQVLPGPEAHELCVHLGMVAGQRRGGVAAGLGFMLPGFVLMLALSWLYFRLNLTQSALSAVFLGVQAGVMALIVRAVHRIGGHVLSSAWLWVISILAGVAAFLGTSFWIVLPASGLIFLLLAHRRYWTAGAAIAAAAALATVLHPPTAVAPLAPAATPLLVAGSIPAFTLFLSGLKAGLLTFGGAYTVIPFLRDDAVGKGWMTDGQFLDGVALSGILPAPLIIFSTFVGYYAGGPTGALAMTAGIFLPAFAFSLLFYDGLERVVENERLHRFLEGVAAGVVGFIVATTLELGVALAQRVPSPLAAAAIFAGALALLYLWKSRLNMVAAIVASGIIGYFAMG